MLGRVGWLDVVARRRQFFVAIARASLVAVLHAAAGPAFATCSCQCVEGVARTACTGVDEARGNPNACGANGQAIACAMPPALDKPPQRYAAPNGGADCHDRRLWDPHTNAYSIVAKVCDLAPVDPNR